MSINRKYITFGVTIVSIIACIILITTFNQLMKQGVIEKAVNSIDAMIYNDIEQDYTQEYFDVYFIDDLSLTENMALDNEIKLYNYYKEHKKNILYNNIYTFEEGSTFIVFMTLLDHEEDIIYYVNISPVLDVLEISMYTLIGILVIVTIILFFIGYKSAILLDASDQRSKRFFENASHELKTPIMAIQGYAEGLEQKVVDSQTASRIILKESERMSSLVDDILNLSKVDSGAIKLNLQKNDLRETLYEIIDSQQPYAKDKKIAFIFQLSKPILLNYDESLIYSALSNIIVNSLRYAQSYVELKVHITLSDIRIIVSNDGKTIPSETIDFLFDRFYTGANGQTGIGLSLALEYVKLHKGNILVNSNDGVTTFEVRLPKS